MLWFCIVCGGSTAATSIIFIFFFLVLPFGWLCFAVISSIPFIVLVLLFVHGAFVCLLSVQVLVLRLVAVSLEEYIQISIGEFRKSLQLLYGFPDQNHISACLKINSRSFPHTKWGLLSLSLRTVQNGASSCKFAR
ncbi:hypothetical protein P8452_58370 [Trifolium repens]|nr:hypothetical protein P8452_58370 [Trifolium repens]